MILQQRCTYVFPALQFVTYFMSINAL